jgi:hypothetical protein
MIVSIPLIVNLASFCLRIMPLASPFRLPSRSDHFQALQVQNLFAKQDQSNFGDVPE